MSLDLQWWGRLAGLLAVEASLVVAMAWLAARWLRSPQMQRAVWQAALLGIALLWVVELAGARGQLARWLPTERPRRTLSVRVLDAPRTEPITDPFPDEPVEAPLPAVTPPRSVWWPGWLWLAGLTLLTGRLALSRAWLMWCVWRPHGRDPGVLRRASVLECARLAAAFVTRTCARTSTSLVRSKKVEAPRSDASTLQDADACSPAPDDTGAMVARLSRQLGLRRVRLLVWPRLRGPVAFGVLRPTVALPEDFRTRFSPSQCEAMLAHELAHLAARDPQWLTLADLVCALAWWHPAVWWARRQLRSACESAADEAAALVPDGRAALAESLVTFGRELASPRWARGIGVAGDGLKSQLARRVKVLLHASGGWCAVRPARMWATRLGATGVVAALVLAPWPGINGAGLAPLLAAVEVKANASPSSGVVVEIVPATNALPAFGGIVLPKPSEVTNAFIRQSRLGYEIPAPVGQIVTTHGYNVTNPADPRAGEVIQRVNLYSNSPPEDVTTTTKSVYVPLRPSDGAEQAPIPVQTDKARQLHSRRFDLPAKEFTGHLTQFLPQLGARDRVNDWKRAVRGFFMIHGVEFPSATASNTGTDSTPQEEKALFFNDRTGVLFLRATLEDLDRVELAIRSLDLPAVAKPSDATPPRASGVGEGAAAGRLPTPAEITGASTGNDLRSREFRLSVVGLDQPFRDHLLHFLPAGETDLKRHLQSAVRSFCYVNGVEVPSANVVNPRTTNASGPTATPTPDQKSAFFNNDTGVLFVRATATEIMRIESAIQSLNLPAAAEPSGSAIGDLHTPGGIALPKPREMTNAFIRQSGLGYEMPDPQADTVPGWKRGKVTAFSDAAVRALEAASQAGGRPRYTFTSGVITQETSEAAAQTLIQAGVRLMEARQFDSAEARFRAALSLAPSNAVVGYYLNLNRANRSTPSSSPLRSAVTLGRTDILAKFDGIVLPEVSFPPVTLTEAARRLQDLAREHDPDKRGVSILIDPAVRDTQPAIDPATGQGAIEPTDLNRVVIHLNGVLHNVHLRDAVAAVAKAAGRPVAWSVEDHAVVYHRPTAEPLKTRTFWLKGTGFDEQLRRYLPIGTTNLQVAIRAFCAVNGVKFPPLIDGRASDAVQFPPFNGGSDAPSQDQKAVFFNDTKGVLFVRASATDLSQLEHAIRSLSLPPALRPFEATPLRTSRAEQVAGFQRLLDGERKQLSQLRALHSEDLPDIQTHARIVAMLEQQISVDQHAPPPTSAIAPTNIELEVQFAEITERGSDDLGLDWLFGQSPTNNPALQNGPATNLLTEAGSPSGPNLRVDLLRTEGQSATLTEAQFAALRKRLESRAGVEFLAAPKLITQSGRQAHVAVNDTRTIVSGVDTTQGSATNQAGIGYQTEQIATGPSVDLVATVEGGATRLAIVAKVTEFLGYDQPKPGQETQAASSDGKLVKGTTPLPHLRVRSTQADVSAGAGETVVLRGPLVSDTMRWKDSVVGWGELPVIGRFFRKEGTMVVRKRLYVFVTPTEVTPTGERRASAPRPTVLTVSISAAAPRLRFGDQAVTEAELPERLVAAHKADPSLVLRIQIGSDAPQADLARLLDAIRTAGITRFDFATEPAAPPGPGR